MAQMILNFARWLDVQGFWLMHNNCHAPHTLKRRALDRLGRWLDVKASHLACSAWTKGAR